MGMHPLSHWPPALPFPQPRRPRHAYRCYRPQQPQPSVRALLIAERLGEPACAPAGGAAASPPHSPFPFVGRTTSSRSYSAQQYVDNSKGKALVAFHL